VPIKCFIILLLFCEFDLLNHEMYIFCILQKEDLLDSFDLQEEFEKLIKHLNQIKLRLSVEI